MKKFAFVFILLFSGAVWADTGLYAKEGEFVVSGVLRKGQDGFTIKLVQSVERAQSENEAVGLFMKKALALHPGYSIVTTLASPLKRQDCDVAI